MSGRARWIVITVVAVVLVAGVWIWAAADSGQDLKPLPDGEKSPGPVSFSDRPLWEGARLGLQGEKGVEVRGAFVTVGDAKGRLAVVDAETGLPHWTLRPGAALPGGGGAVYGVDRSDVKEGGALGFAGRPVLAGTGDDWSVLVPYRVGEPRDDRWEQGVAALSGKDGRVRWKRPLVRPTEPAAGPGRRGVELRVMAADERAVLAVAQPGLGDDVVTFALDAADGRERWRVPGLYGVRFAGGVVLAERYGSRGDEPPGFTGVYRYGKRRSSLTEASLLGLDAASGRTRWELRSPSRSWLVTSTPTHAIVQTGSSSFALVDTATGRVRHRLSRWLEGCADDGAGLIACATSEDKLVTIRVAGGSGVPRITEDPVLDGEILGDVSVDAVHGDRIFVSGENENDAVIAAMVDRAGNRLGATVPYAVAAVTDRYAAIRVPMQTGTTRASSDDRLGLAFHRVAPGSVPPPGPGPSGAPRQRPLALEARPLWAGRAGSASAAGTGPDLRVGGLERMSVLDGTIVYSGRDVGDSSGWRLGAVDAENGRERWSVSEGTPLPQGLRPAADFAVTGRPDRGALVVVPYRNEPGPVASPKGRTGVMALAPDSGKVRWRTGFSVTDGDPSAVVASDAVVAVGTGYRTESFRPDSSILTVLDARTGRKRWSKPFHDPVGVAGTTVVARRKGGSVVGLDAATGRQRWSRAGVEPLHVAGRTAVIVRSAAGAAVLDPSTGRELARTGAPLERCQGGERLVACRALAGSKVGRMEGDPTYRPGAEGERVPYAVAVRLAPGSATVTALPWTAPTGFTAHEERLFVTWKETAYGSRSMARGEFLTADGEGRVVSDDLPGLPYAVGSRYVVVLDGGGFDTPVTKGSFAVYRRTA